MFCRMTCIPEDWFVNASKPWQGVKRAISIECTLPMVAWSSVRAIIASTPKEDLSRRAFFPPMIGSCDWCGAVVKRNAFEMKKADKKGSTGIYCGHSCQQMDVNRKLGKLGKSCKECGAHLPRYFAGSRSGKIFCTDICKAAGAEKTKQSREYVTKERPCEVCNMVFRPKSTRQPGRFCSRACKDHGHAMQMLAEKNPGWRDGANKARLDEHSAKSFRAAKPMIIQRDGGECVVCAAKSQLHVHHIDMNASNNRWVNLVTLCSKCHMELHGAERQKPRVFLWPWLSAYAGQPRCMTSKWMKPSAFLQMESLSTTA